MMAFRTTGKPRWIHSHTITQPKYVLPNPGHTRPDAGQYTLCLKGVK